MSAEETAKEVLPAVFGELLSTGAKMIGAWFSGNAEQKAAVEAAAQKSVDESQSAIEAAKAKFEIDDAESQAIIDAERKKREGG